MVLPAPRAPRRRERSDRGVLDAVRYHSIGLAEWDMVGPYPLLRRLPGAGAEASTGSGGRSWRNGSPGDRRGVIREVATARVGHLVTSGRPLLEPTVRFWNSLVAESSGSD